MVRHSASVARHSHFNEEWSGGSLRIHDDRLRNLSASDDTTPMATRQRSMRAVGRGHRSGRAGLTRSPYLTRRRGFSIGGLTRLRARRGSNGQQTPAESETISVIDSELKRETSVVGRVPLDALRPRPSSLLGPSAAYRSSISLVAIITAGTAICAVTRRLSSARALPSWQCRAAIVPSMRGFTIFAGAIRLVRSTSSWRRNPNGC